MDKGKVIKKLSFLGQIVKLISGLPFPANVIVGVIAIILVIVFIVLLGKVMKWIILGLIIYFLIKLLLKFLKRRKKKVSSGESVVMDAQYSNTFVDKPEPEIDVSKVFTKERESGDKDV